jgi:hypothetical protein
MIALSQKIIDVIQNARDFVYKNTNTTMVISYFSIGRMIVEELQHGNEKAIYGTKLLEHVSSDLTKQLGRGFSVDNLENMRKFYLAYASQFLISENSSRILENQLISETLSRKLPNQFLSWSHYLFLSRIENLLERNFYEIEITLPQSNNQIFASKYQTILPKYFILTFMENVKTNIIF